jgi:electron transport complex protein RnfD
MLFGPAAASVLGFAIASAVGPNLLINWATQRMIEGDLWHAALTGLLLGLTLPARTSWYVPVIASAVAIFFAKSLFGGIGHYLWHPALVGRVAVQLLFIGTLSFGGHAAGESVLVRGHLWFGSLTSARPADLAFYDGWAFYSSAADAITMERPVHALRRFADGAVRPEGKLIFAPLLRDALPPWEDTVVGAVPGGIGETPTLALVVVGLFLIYRGYLRWQLPVSILTAAALTAAVFPVEISGGGYRWLPALAVENGRAVGLAYVLYHLTAGELMLGAFLLAGDMTTSPKRALGQVVFGAVIGLVTIFMRLYGLLPCACYWSILFANTLVPVIDRRTRRPVLGMNDE